MNVLKVSCIKPNHGNRGSYYYYCSRLRLDLSGRPFRLTWFLFLVGMMKKIQTEESLDWMERQAISCLLQTDPPLAPVCLPFRKGKWAGDIHRCVPPWLQASLRGAGRIWNRTALKNDTAWCSAKSLGSNWNEPGFPLLWQSSAVWLCATFVSLSVFFREWGIIKTGHQK